MESSQEAPVPYDNDYIVIKVPNLETPSRSLRKLLRSVTHRKVKRSGLFAFLSKSGVELKELGFRLSHFTVLLIFLVFVGAIVASVVMKSHWLMVAVAGAVGLRSIPLIMLKGRSEISRVESADSRLHG